jgi:hypothetical protein
MKTIEYCGGVVAFRIPSDWKEEYEDKGGGTFFEDAPDSGTLRLSVLTFRAPPGKLAACGYDQLVRDPAEDDVSIAKLSSGDGLKQYCKQTQDGGESLDVHYWEVAHCAPPEKHYLAVFSYTILTTRRDNQKFRQEIQMITDEVKQIRFHPDLGSL